jgi:putative colanic acid biosynthesis UDP-glucose lipid carrier transferase
MNKQLKYYLQLLVITMDFFLLNSSYFITINVVHNSISPNFDNPFVQLILALNIFWIILTFFLGAYAERMIIDFESFTKRTVQIYFFWIISILFYLVFLRDTYFSRIFLIIIITNFGLGLFLSRFFYFGLKHYFKFKNHFVNRVLILGFNETANKLAHYFEEEGINTQLLGFIEDKKNIRELSHYPIIADLKKTIEVAKRLEVQEIFSTITPEQNNFIYSLMLEAEKECMRFKVVPNLSIFLSKPVVIDYIRDLPILSLRSEPLDDVGNRFKKRIIDIVVSLFAIVFFLSWMIPIFGLLILLESNGPIFFAQLRTGRNNKAFFCLKFRTMKVNVDSDSKQATKNDSRVTRLGLIMRKTSLDEFPQFINVLKGEMSIVGPRPHMLKHTDDFSKIVEHYMTRQFLKPGITGWAQINSFRGEITNQEQIKMRVASDLWYLENWNIWLDLRILFLTIYHVFKGDKNAY